MAGPKSLPFDRVRVIVNAEAGPCCVADRVRSLTPPRWALERPWRDAKLEKAASAPASARRAGAQSAGPAPPAGEPGTGSGDEIAAGDDRRATVLVVPALAGQQEQAEPAGNTEPEPAPAPSQPPRTSGDWQRGRQQVGAVGPVAAVARAVEESALIHALADLLRDTCGDEALRETGPWEFSLQLHSVGLGDSSVELRLSRELLSLRFCCREPGIAHVLLRHKDRLLEMLQQELPGPLEIEISVVEI